MASRFLDSNGARYGLAVLLALAAIALQWAVIPLVGVRIPFAFLFCAIGAAAFYCGTGPALLVLALGVANAPGQFEPFGVWSIASPRDRTALVIFTLAGLAAIAIGSRIRALHESARSSLADIEQLHDLGLKLAAIHSLEEQLQLVLSRLAGMVGAQKGLLSHYSREDGRLHIAASLGFSEPTLIKLREIRGGEGACGIACAEGRRVIVEDTETDAAIAPYRELARVESVRSVHSTPFIGSNGEVLGAVSLHFPDPRVPDARERQLTEICARIIAVHVERANAQQSARESDKRLRRVVDASAVPFTILAPIRDQQNRICDFAWSYLNDSAARKLGLDANHLIGRPVNEVLPGSWDEPGVFENYVSALEKDEVCEFELHSMANGIEGWFQVIAYQLDGNLAIWFADITRRKTLELELRTADKRKDEFLATLAHELRNPLAPIRQAALLLKKGATAQRDWCTDVIERQVRQMSSLLDDLLDVSRITRGSLQLRREATRLGTLIDSAVETSRHLIDNRNHQLIVEIDDPELEIDVDPVRMTQVIANLLNNAAKYSRAGGTIRLHAGSLEGALTLQVSDSGIGIRPGDLESIFEMFSQVRSAEEFSEGGLGIGLALTRGVVELHGGTIVAESGGPGLGSTFKVNMPGVIRGPKSAATSSQAPRIGISRTVLVADDNHDAAESLAMLIDAEGHQVMTAHDGEAAVKLFAERKPDVALLDIGMPKLDGYEVARQIRAMPQGGSAILIAVTGWGQSGDRTRSSEAGFDHHLTKPVDYDALMKLIIAKKPRLRVVTSPESAQLG